MFVNFFYTKENNEEQNLNFLITSADFLGANKFTLLNNSLSSSFEILSQILEGIYHFGLKRNFKFKIQHSLFSYKIQGI